MIDLAFKGLHALHLTLQAESMGFRNAVHVIHGLLGMRSMGFGNAQKRAPGEQSQGVRLL
jgi:hypothetical protein